MGPESLPKFDTFDEMEKYLDAKNKEIKAAKKASKKTSTASRKSRQPRGTAKASKSVELVLDKPRQDIMSAVHFYMRENDSPQVVNQLCKDERAFRNVTVAVFGHNHKFGEACLPSCREYLKED